MDTNNSYKLIFTEQFLQELEKVGLHLFKSLRFKQRSNDIMNKIDDALIQTTIFPRSHERIPNTQYRKILVKNYIIIYKINEKRKEIYIVHIFYSKSNYLKKLYFNLFLI